LRREVRAVGQLSHPSILAARELHDLDGALGLARVAGASTLTTRAMGTTGNAAPEVYRDARLRLSRPSTDQQEVDGLLVRLEGVTRLAVEAVEEVEGPAGRPAGESTPH